jgi:hypothetical protein
MYDLDEDDEGSLGSDDATDLTRPDQLKKHGLKKIKKKKLTFKEKVKEFIEYVKREWSRNHKNPLWAKPIKTIEGRFGAGVASFFTFIRLLLEINVVCSMVMTIFVVIPAASAWCSGLDTILHSRMLLQPTPALTSNHHACV